MEDNKAKNPNWQEANQLAIVQAWPRISLNAGLPKTHPGIAVRVGLEVGASGLQVRRSNCSSKLPLTINHLFKNGREMEGCPGLLFIATLFEIFDLLSELDQPLNNIVPKKVSKGFKSVRI